MLPGRCHRARLLLLSWWCGRMVERNATSEPLPVVCQGSLLLENGVMDQCLMSRRPPPWIEQGSWKYKNSCISTPTLSEVDEHGKSISTQRTVFLSPESKQKKTQKSCCLESEGLSLWHLWKPTVSHRAIPDFPP